MRYKSISLYSNAWYQITYFFKETTYLCKFIKIVVCLALVCWFVSSIKTWTLNTKAQKQYMAKEKDASPVVLPPVLYSPQSQNKVLTIGSGSEYVCGISHVCGKFPVVTLLIIWAMCAYWLTLFHNYSNIRLAQAI